MICFDYYIKYLLCIQITSQYDIIITPQSLLCSNITSFYFYMKKAENKSNLHRTRFSPHFE